MSQTLVPNPAPRGPTFQTLDVGIFDPEPFCLESLADDQACAIRFRSRDCQLNSIERLQEDYLGHLNENPTLVVDS